MMRYISVTLFAIKITFECLKIFHQAGRVSLPGSKSSSFVSSLNLNSFLRDIRASPLSTLASPSPSSTIDLLPD